MHKQTETINTYYIYSVHMENGRPVETTHSDTCLGVTGYSSREMSDAPYLWIDMVFEDDRSLVLEQIEKVLSGLPSQSFEHRIIHKEGSVRWVENSIVPRSDTSGKLISYYGVVRSIADPKIESRLFKQREKEKRQDKRIGSLNDCWAKINDSGNITVENMSIGGICLKTSHNMPISANYQIGLFNNMDEISSRGEVAWSSLEMAGNEESSPYYRVGLRFIEMKEDMKITLIRLISTVNYT